MPDEVFTRLIREPCHFCGDPGKVGIDRMDNAIGYTEANVVPACWTCNRLKGAMPYAAFVAWLLRAGAHQRSTATLALDGGA